MELVILVWAGIGSVGGFYVGRWWAEVARAKFDMKRVWDGRQSYRQ